MVSQTTSAPPGEVGVWDQSLPSAVYVQVVIDIRDYPIGESAADALPSKGRGLFTDRDHNPSFVLVHQTCSTGGPFAILFIGVTLHACFLVLVLPDHP